jgi:hypothetical protein
MDQGAIAYLKARLVQIDEHIFSLGRSMAPVPSEHLAELSRERGLLKQAILSLKAPARGGGRKRGRPPAWMSEVTVARRRGRPPGWNPPTDPVPPLPPRARMRIPRPPDELVWAVSGRKRLA